MNKPLKSGISGFDLFDQFEQLIAFWQDLRLRIEQDGSREKPLRNADGEAVADIPAYVHAQLQQYIQARQQAVAAYATPIQQQFFDDMLYAFTALVDELLLRSVRWDHARDWLSSLLEQALFGSRHSGDRLLRLIDRFCDRNAGMSELEKDLAKVYIYVIWLGFAGAWYNREEQLAQLIVNLQQAAELDLPDRKQTRLFNQAYLHNKNKDEQTRLAPISAWHRLMFWIVLGYLAVSGIVWLGLTWQLNQHLG